MPPQQPVGSPPPSQASSKKVLLIVLISLGSLFLLGIITSLLIIVFTNSNSSDDQAARDDTSQSADVSDEGEENDSVAPDDQSAGNEGEAAVSESPDNGATLDEDLRASLQVIATGLKQDRQEMVDLLESRGIEEYKLAGWFKGVDDSIFLLENNLDRFSLLSTEELLAWRGEIAMSNDTYEKKLTTECETLHTPDTDSGGRCLIDATNRWGQEMTIIHKRYDLIE